MLRWLLIVLAIVVVVFLLRRRYLFKIAVRHGEPRLLGVIPGRSWPEVKDFLTSLSLPSGSTIVAHRDERRFRLSFSRDIPESARQRIRNFLYLGF